jgi:hypothetical protein
MLAAIASLGLCASACGGAGSTSGASVGAAASTAPVAALPRIELKGDPDLDSDAYPGEADPEHELFGHPARASDVRAAAALVTRYYRAAARGDGAAACRLLYAPFAESVYEDYEGKPGLSGGKGATCGAVLSRIFANMRTQLRAESAALRVGAVRVRLSRAAVQLRFARKVRYTMVHRYRGDWRMDMLFDREGPFVVE